MQETIKTKVCTKCQVEKSVELFSKSKATKDGLQTKCKECDKAYNQANTEKYAEYRKAYYQANAEAIIERIKTYQKANREGIAEYRKAYYQENAEKNSVNQKAYYQANAEKYAEYHKTYRQTTIGKAARKNSNHKRRSITKQGDINSKQLLELEQNAKACYWCGVSLKGKKIHIDHYLPLKLGGEHTLSNLVVSCSHCNLTKNAKDPLKFAQSVGKLF